MNTATQLLDRCRDTINELWAIIDDIDSYGDMAKDDDKLFRKLVERRQLDRWNNTDIRTDGYSLTEGIAADIETYLAKQQVEQEPESFERLAKLGWNAVECSICGSHAMAYPKPAREPMSDDEIKKIASDFFVNLSGSNKLTNDEVVIEDYESFAHAIEAHHGIK